MAVANLAASAEKIAKALIDTKEAYLFKLEQVGGLFSPHSKARENRYILKTSFAEHSLGYI